MTLGEKLKQARLDAGLSQRQLCGDRLTRNMLSQIENGSAKPSMGTLGYLAQSLGKSVSWFLEEDAVALPNAPVMEKARIALALEKWEELERALGEFAEPDPVFQEERQLLSFLWRLRSGQQALAEDRLPLARELLAEALATDGLYITAPLRDRCRVLLTLAGGEGDPVCDEEMLLARAARAEGLRRLEILGASDRKEDPRWQLLRAEAAFQNRQYREASVHYALAEAAYPEKALRGLEACCRELEDYKMAYHYACRLRELQSK